MLERVGRQTLLKQVVSFEAVPDRTMQRTSTSKKRYRPAYRSVFWSLV
jgi:hypothetical protein